MTISPKIKGHVFDAKYAEKLNRTAAMFKQEFEKLFPRKIDK